MTGSPSQLAGLVVLLLATFSPACKRAKIVEGFPDSFAGVGLELKIEGNTPVAVRAIPGGSAEQAGVLAGDRVLAVDGATTVGASLGDVVMKLRGKPDSQVTLTLDRNGQRLIVAMRRTKMVKKKTDYGSAP